MYTCAGGIGTGSMCKRWQQWARDVGWVTSLRFISSSCTTPRVTGAHSTQRLGHTAPVDPTQACIWGATCTVSPWLIQGCSPMLSDSLNLTSTLVNPPSPQLAGPALPASSRAAPPLLLQLAGLPLLFSVSAMHHMSITPCEHHPSERYLGQQQARGKGACSSLLWCAYGGVQQCISRTVSQIVVPCGQLCRNSGEERTATFGVAALGCSAWSIT